MSQQEPPGPSKRSQHLPGVGQSQERGLSGCDLHTFPFPAPPSVATISESPGRWLGCVLWLLLGCPPTLGTSREAGTQHGIGLPCLRGGPQPGPLLDTTLLGRAFQGVFIWGHEGCGGVLFWLEGVLLVGEMAEKVRAWTWTRDGQSSALRCQGQARSSSPTQGPHVLLRHCSCPDCPSCCRLPDHSFQNLLWKHRLWRAKVSVLFHSPPA